MDNITEFCEFTQNVYKYVDIVEKYVTNYDIDCICC